MTPGRPPRPASRPGSNAVATVVLALALLLAPGLLAGQTGPEGDYRRIASVNPLALVILGAFSVEYEHVWGQNTSWGAAASYHERSRWSYFAVEAKARYYLGGSAFDGLSAGALLGFNLAEDDDTGDSGGAVGIGFTAEHQWLLGEDRRLALTAGAGGKRLFYVTDVEGAPRGIPMVRLSVGWAF